MDWILFVFKHGRHYYLVPADSEEDAWGQLTKRQSIRLELTKKQYKLVTVMNGNQNIIKL
jgi:hypothetical protein